MPSPPEPLRPEPMRIARLLALVRSQTRRNFDKAAVLQTAASLSEALTVAMLIPLLHVMGNGSQAVRIAAGGAAVTLSLPLVLAGFVILIALRSLSLERKEAFNARVTFGFVESMQARFFAALAATRWSVVSRWRAADMTHATVGDSDRLLQSITLLLTFVQSIAMAMVLSLLSLALSWQMTLLAAAVGVVLLLVTLPGRGRVLARSRRMFEARQSQFRITDEFFNGLRTAKAFGLEQRHVGAMQEVLREVRDGNIAFTMDRVRTATIYQVATALALAGFVWFSLAVAGLNMATTVTMLFLYMRLAPRVVTLHSTWQQLRTQLGSIEAMLGMLDEAERNAEPEPRGGQAAISLHKSIEISDVQYSYDEGKTQALRGISATISAGRVTAIVGPTGSGKSTMIDLLMGLIDPDKGRIAVDGVPLDRASSRAWLGRVGYVPQETYLFNATIADNLRVANGAASDEQLWDALRVADAAGFVRELPGGLEYHLGDRGRGLSGGERQRLAIARALLRRPDLLILDEATSALDALSQRRVARAISGLREQMTIVVVAHRLSVVSFADDVIVLEDGGITAAGPTRQLMAGKSGHLREVVDAESDFTYIRP